ncbi:hypothetical protein [Anthocerotibacter panamensis]|uniref:hypothetical protein n=1 Tax=Anthocerotibacter panamensis TaxID=2857077 RepID=UPI001C4043E4|nr:hypothetical protein [Anthocerotibacter panamensis]
MLVRAQGLFRGLGSEPHTRSQALTSMDDFQAFQMLHECFDYSFGQGLPCQMS